MISKLERIIFEQFCGIELSELENNEIVDPTKIKISADLNEEIIKKINAEYDDLNRHKITLLLLNYGPSVDLDQTSGTGVRLLDGYIKTVGN